jgi:hypothetical protein
MARFVHQFVGSKYFTPAFNSAVFDGALRVYFAQSQESFALSFYQNLKSQIKWSFKADSLDYVLVLIYPRDEWLQTDWAKIKADQNKPLDWALEQFDDDLVLAISDGLILDVETEAKIHKSLQEALSNSAAVPLAL